MMRALGIAQIVIAVLLLPLTIFPLPFAPTMMIGPVWGIVLGVRMWKRRDVATALRRTHYAFLVIDVLLIWSGIAMLRHRPYSTRHRLPPRPVFSRHSLAYAEV